MIFNVYVDWDFVKKTVAIALVFAVEKKFCQSL